MLEYIYRDRQLTSHILIFSYSIMLYLAYVYDRYTCICIVYTHISYIIDASIASAINRYVGTAWAAMPF